MSEIPGASRPVPLRFALPCDLKQVRQAAQTAHHFLAGQGCDEQILSACELALVEACNNAIKYAPETAQDTPALVEILCAGELIEMRVTDHTRGFDWPKHVELPDPESESGRGLYLIQSLMDGASYLRGNGENTLVMRKSRPSTARENQPEASQDKDQLISGLLEELRSCYESLPAVFRCEAEQNKVADLKKCAHRLLADLMSVVGAREREIAESIQQSLLLKELPQLPGFELAALCRSAHQIGGDFYDVLKISNDSALLVIADVMGKGVLAAMFAAILRTVLRSAPELTRQPAALLSRVNDLLFEELSSADMFITAQLAFVDVASRKLVTASAGHCPLLIATAAHVKPLSPDGMPLGILPDTVFSSEMVELPRDCRVLLYTDGLTEALDADGERYGQERLSAWLTGVNSGARELKEKLAEKLAQFQMKSGLNDDQTFLIMTG